MNLSAQELPLTELEAANEAAETLLTDHQDLLPSDLAALLAAFRSDLTVVIEEHYGMTGEAGEADEAGG